MTVSTPYAKKYFSKKDTVMSTSYWEFLSGNSNPLDIFSESIYTVLVAQPGR